nr:hypothetical protein [Tanacetum cinerariifolium]
MSSKAQHIALDNALVAQENQRVIGKCKMRINPGMKPRESTYQVVLDALALTTCYPTFLITAEVPVIYIHQILGQEFDEPPTKEEALSFICEFGHSGEIKYITDVIVDHLHQPWRNFASIINKCLCGKETPSKKKPTKAKKDVPYKKKPSFKPKPTKNKAPVKADKGKGLNVLSEVALSEAAQRKEATKRSKKDFYISQASGSGDGTDFESRVPDEQQRKISCADEGIGTKPGVLDAPKYLFDSKNESWGDSDDDERNDDNSDEVTRYDDEDDVERDANDDKEASDTKKTDSDEDENLNLNPNANEEEEK